MSILVTLPIIDVHVLLLFMYRAKLHYLHTSLEAHMYPMLLEMLDIVLLLSYDTFGCKILLSYFS